MFNKKYTKKFHGIQGIGKEIGDYIDSDGRQTAFEETLKNYASKKESTQMNNGQKRGGEFMDAARKQ